LTFISIDFNQGEGIWTENNLKTVTTTRNEAIRFSLIAAPNNSSDIFQDLKVDGSLQISILAGLMELKGLAEYLTKTTKTNFRESSVHVRCHCHTLLNEFPKGQLEDGQISYLQLARAGGNGTATHVISQIQYGAEAIFTLTTSLEEADDVNEAKSRLRDYAGNLVKILSGSADADGSVAENNCDKELNLRCHFESDFQLTDNFKCPTTYEEAKTFDRNFTQVLYNSIPKDNSTGNEPLGVPQFVSLYPLALLKDGQSAPV
jgi:hypothetical protein